jgi:hypothetical protein
MLMLLSSERPGPTLTMPIPVMLEALADAGHTPGSWGLTVARPESVWSVLVLPIHGHGADGCRGVRVVMTTRN